MAKVTFLAAPQGFVVRFANYTPEAWEEGGSPRWRNTWRPALLVVVEGDDGEWGVYAFRGSGGDWKRIAEVEKEDSHLSYVLQHELDDDD